MDKLILDLRDNGGGYLDKAIDLADEFIAGEKLIMYTDGKGERFDDTYYAKRAGVFEERKLIVLVDENSASAAEILSGALQDNDRALIVGRRSYGKGLVQKPITLKDKSELRLTISRYYTPSGRSIQRSYAEGVEAYFDDINERYTHGELFSKDSVHFPDSLKYTTGNGRVVYGGGGIMPDVFIPADTGVVSGALRKVYAEGAHREFAVQYAATNKSMLSSMSFEAFRRNAAFGQEMLEAFKIFLAERGMEEITSTKEQEKLLKLLMAFVARNVWDDEGFYPIYLQDDKTLNISKTLFDDIEDRLNGQ